MPAWLGDGPAVLLRRRHGPDQVEVLADLRRLLGDSGYAEEQIPQALGQDSRPFSRHPDFAVAQSRLPEGRLGALIKLFLLGLPVRGAEARTALAPIPLERLASMGLVKPEAGSVRARVRLLPHEGLLLACDLATARSGSLPRDYVDGLIESAPVLAALTVRRPVGSVLDLGTGSGVQALLAARHSHRVVAVDVNPRALRFTAFNARLNGLPHVECRRGNLFEPVERRRFDLIVSNPPYVISPESAVQYRDSGCPGDTFCRALVRRAPRFLREGGWAQILCHWVTGTHSPWWARLRAWVAGSGFDAWLFHHMTREPPAYAAHVNAPLRWEDPAAYAASLDRWLRYYHRLGIEAIAEGAIFLRRRSRGPNWLRADEFPAERIGRSGDQILRTADLQDYLTRLADDRALLEAVLRPVPAHRLEPATGRGHGRPARSALLQLDDGLAFQLEVEADAMLLLARCDGRRPLRELVADLARVTGRAPARLAAALLPTVRRLVRQGFLVPSPSPKSRATLRGSWTWS